MKYWLPIGVFAALLLSRPVCAGEPSITIVTPGNSMERDVVLCETPDQWLRGPGNLREAGGKLVVVKFPYPRFYSFSAASVSAPVDAFALNGDGQVLAVFDGVTGAGERAHSEEVVSVVFSWSKEKLPAKNVKPGSLVVAKGFTLHATTAAPPGTSRYTEVMERLKKSAGSHQQSFGDLAAFYLSAGEYAQALAYYQRVVAGREEPDIRAGVGIAQAGLGRIDDALATFGKLLEDHPLHLPAYRHLSRLLRFLKKPDLVVAMLLSGLEKNPGLLELRLQLAQIFVQAGRTDAARKVLDEAPDPGEEEKARIAKVLGDAHLRDGDAAQAALSYTLYLERFPHAPHAAELRIFVARHRNNDRGGKP